MIYIIKNKINFKYYLGSTIDFRKRRNTHINELNKNKHHSIKLQRAWNKYGAHNFVFEIYLECEHYEMKDLEQLCLDFLEPQYNISKSSICPMLNRKHSKNTLKKFKNRKQPKGKDSPFFGRKLTQEHIEKIRNAHLGSRRSLKTRLKMRRTALMINSIKRIDRNKVMKKVIDSKGNIFKSLKDASIFWNITVMTVCDILKGRHKQTRKGIKFYYV